jgi:2-(1,2-epoxy-1,2-dihydrophenyl)acetyl-CoA isomerase
MMVAKALASRFSAGPRTATGCIKAAITAAAQNDLPKQLELEAAFQLRCGRTDDFVEGVAAFSEKRAPHFAES